MIDIRDSEAWLSGGVDALRTDDTVIVLEAGKEPAVQGSLRTASAVSDALMLQYYEEDPDEAAFGHTLDEDQWREIAGIKDVYHGVLAYSPLIARNAAHPLLKELRGEMARDGRKFAFLCGHDLNLGSVLTALSAAPYELPGAIETRTPIGGKLVFSRWLSPDGDVFWDVDLVYQTPEQLRDVDILTADHSPAVCDLSFEDLPQTDDGLFPEAALMARFDFAIGEYDSMAALYGRP